MKAEDIHHLEHRVREVPEALEEFGPDYAIELDPHAHKIEGSGIGDIYRGRGFQGEALEMVVNTITSDPKVWLRVMMQEELGLSQGFGQPLGAALTVFVAFLVAGT